ncbi:hypothetical protein [Sulfurimonas marina]|uniref:Periplasmic protein n=1 Tax=Sulfurimonas marina TaxID=2590551 RepID=A0A7M1AUN7_9BACT|nr:hypothetical protein [Sulfurimonas marina]QOP41143.1 hypothetical protein FJR03_05055 [Sulfurimonas marina]
MKKIFLTLLLPFAIFAQSYLVSDIPLPKTYVLDLDPYECDEDCLQEFLDNEQIFSFLSHAQRKLPNKELEEIRMINAAIFNIGVFNTNGNFQVALLLPYKRIGKYATSTTNAVFAYLMTKTTPFNMKSYKIEDENYDTIEATLQQIKADGIEYVIAPLTHEGVENTINIDPEVNIYFPTTNKNDIETNSPYLSFGGIDYSAQSDLLLKEAISPLVVFSDTSATGKKLALYQENRFLHPVVEGAEPSAFSEEHEIQTPPSDENKKVLKYYISTRTTNLERYLKENENIIEGSFMINTPIIKTGMIMSQLTLYDTNATNVLSTQINYNPLLLSMTQYRDRENMVIANSITKEDNMQIEMNSLIGNDIKYDWINYATIIGVDYFYSLVTGEARVYDLVIENEQVIYDIELLQPMRTKFAKYIPLSKELEERED